MVESIEKSIKTTQNHYGRYMSLLTSLAKGDNRKAKLFAAAMIEAGANKQGVASALKLATGNF